jgi:hypothetical protein
MGFAGIGVNGEAGEALASRPAKSANFAKSEAGYITVDLTNFAIPHWVCALNAEMISLAPLYEDGGNKGG